MWASGSEAAMNSVETQILLGDIGGSNARFALLAGAQLGPVETLLVKDHPHFADALRAFLTRHGQGSGISQALLAVAGPVERGRCELTNSSWTIDAEELRKTFDLPKVRVINDFEALAWSLPLFDSSDLCPIGQGQVRPGAPMVALGPGTGLGLACHLPRAEGPIVMSTEAGHATLPATNRREDAVIQFLREKFGHVSLERALSGDGLENLYRTIRSIDDLPPLKRSAAEITAAALDGACPVCREALELFCGMLGTVAGNAALTFCARGGVYIAGGITPRIVDFLQKSQFRSRFESKGRFERYLANIPTWVVVHQKPAFVGLQWLALQERDPASPTASSIPIL
jgi:glucokinase